VSGSFAALVLPSPARAAELTAAVGAAAAPFEFSAEPYAAHGAQQRSEFSYELQPGHQILDQFVVKNLSTADESFLIYGEDATNVARTGGYGFEQRAQMHNTAVGLWTTIGITRLTVPRGKEVIETFQLSIPSNAPPGDHVGGVVVEELKGRPAQNKPVGVNVVLRVAIPMYVHVVGRTFPSLTIENLRVFHESPAFPYLSSSKVAVRFDLVNTGNVIIDPGAVTASITGRLSGTIHSYTVRQTGPTQSRTNPLPQQMLPGARLTLTEEWSGIPPFDPLTSHVSATASQPGATQGLSTSASTAFWYFPWIVFLLVVLLVAAVIALIVLRRRRKSAADSTDDGDGGTPSRPDRGTLEKAGI
ncbi:MAG TPA: hypothetical protein VKI19_14770, partial [Acidimicrobiales bacterium]|nr:hypothetical protein [Acidimicrobiales bacterium]